MALCIFSFNQSFCGTDYLKIINSVGNKILGTVCLAASGAFLTKTYARYHDAWKNHRRNQDYQQDYKRINTFFTSWRNQNLKWGTLHLAVAGVFGYSAYHWFKK